MVNWYEVFMTFGFGVSFTLVVVGMIEANSDDRPELLQFASKFANSHNYTNDYKCLNYSPDCHYCRFTVGTSIFTT